MIKISFSGISGSGKTSLLNEVKKILSLKYKVSVIDEVNGKNPFDNSRRSSFVSQFFYISTQINEENIHTTSPGDFLLCNRSVLDQWIYWRNRLSEMEKSPALEEKNKLLENLYRFWIKTYDLIFFIRMSANSIESRELTQEFRTTEPEYIKRMEECFMETIRADNLNVTEIWNNGTIDNSTFQIIRRISDYREMMENQLK